MKIKIRVKSKMSNFEEAKKTATIEIKIENFLLTVLFSFISQGIPTCPVTLEALRSHLPDLSCWGLPPAKGDSEEVAGNNNNNSINNNNNIITNDFFGASEKDHTNLTPLHRFYKQQQQRKMPVFRGRRGLCGCFQVIMKSFRY